VRGLSSPVHDTPVAEGEHDQHLALPIHVEDDPVLTDPKFVGLDGTKPRKKPLWILRNRVELPGDSVLQGPIKLAVLLCRKGGEFDSVARSFIPLPSDAPT